MKTNVYILYTVYIFPISTFDGKLSYGSLFRRKLGHATLQVTFIYTCINFIKQGSSFTSEIIESTVSRIFFFVRMFGLLKFCDIR